MAFTKKNFGGNVGAGSDTAKLFMYKTADTKAATIASGYFNDLADIVKVGDVIIATTDTGTTAKPYIIYVLTNSGTVVTTGFAAVA
tara:strand:- start:885 stop:1142 length:258 start_codon:yes stop_codon:yes gene_type:complete